MRVKIRIFVTRHSRDLSFLTLRTVKPNESSMSCSSTLPQAPNRASLEGNGHSFLNLPGGLPAHVLAYVGPGEWTYVGAVSKRCQEAYLSALSAADKPASSASH
eukprot:6423-Heterococcus_DN1.PRE.2